jgi:hypothetical protein
VGYAKKGGIDRVGNVKDRKDRAGARRVKEPEWEMRRTEGGG